jgi:hypothetical protein
MLLFPLLQLRPFDQNKSYQEQRGQAFSKTIA